MQHAHNPVNWYPWGEEALQKAKDENKLIIVSVGYAACHWCHVMEHESFEDVEVAAYMNEHFVCIKVDREERPDIDQVYMNAVQLITGRGGWPLNCIALPDGRPLYGGTYFPKEQWLSVLSQVYNFVNQNPEKTEEQAQKLVQGIQGSDVVQRGAYRGSLDGLKAAGQRVKMLWQHDPTQPIGVWDEVREDERGLRVRGRLLDCTQRGREAAALIEAGAIDGLSIGYRTKKAVKDGKGQRLLTELELWEVSLVTFPMLPSARVSSKGEDPAAEIWRDLAAAFDGARLQLARS